MCCVTQCMECYYCRAVFIHNVDGSWIFGYMIDGCQADYVRVPYADSGMHLIPEGLTDEGVICGDILSTGYFGAESGNIQPGDTVVFSVLDLLVCALWQLLAFGDQQELSR